MDSSFVYVREYYKSYYERQLAQVEERPAGLKSRRNVDEDAESARLRTVSFKFLKEEKKKQCISRNSTTAT